MKGKVLTIALLAAMIGFGSCKNSDKKSSECKIEKFVVNGVEYGISGTSITHLYPKPQPNTWENLPAGQFTPEITISAKATIDPPASTKRTIDEFDAEKGNGVTYTVTAEDGSKQSYTVKITKGTYQ